jgi:transposase
MSEQERQSKRTYFRPTTAQQRRLLFETYERTGNVDEACRAARMARRTFYYWLPRFRDGGYAALEQERSRAPHKTRIPPTPHETVQEVIAYRQTHPKAGYRRIAAELKKAHDWQAVISPTQVRRILLKAGLVPDQSTAKKAKPAVTTHAPEPEQTINIDLCVVPISHEAKQPLKRITLTQTEQAAFSPSGGGDASAEVSGAGVRARDADLRGADDDVCQPAAGSQAPGPEALPATDTP